MPPTPHTPRTPRTAHPLRGDRPGPLRGPGAPLWVQGPDGPWDEAGERLEDTGRAVLCTTWGQWLTAVLLDPALRPLLGEDWPRFRQTPAAAGRMRFAVSRFVLKHAAATALQVPVHSVELGRGPGGHPVLRGPGAGAGLGLGLAHAGELIVVGVSRTGPVGVAARPADHATATGTGGDTATGAGLPDGHACTREEEAALAALPGDERRVRLLRLWTLKEACARMLGPGEQPPGPATGPATGPAPGSGAGSAVGFAFDGRGRVTVTGAAGARAAAGEWSFASHLVLDRYLVGEAHRPRP
ncbi:4'-phosphopantetheinyl transferase family protein [Streptomyces sp. NPDC054932]